MSLSSQQHKVVEANRTGAGSVDDGPRFMCNIATYRKYARRMADKLGMSIADWIMVIDNEINVEDRDVVKTVSHYPTGDPDTKNSGTDYQGDISDDRAYNLWVVHAKRVATVANDVTVADIEPKEVVNEDVSDGDGVEFNHVEGGYRRVIAENIGDIDQIIDAWEGVFDVNIPNEVREDMYWGLFEDILDEKTYKDLRSKAPQFLRIRDKSRKTPGSRYVGINGNVLEFQTPSHTKAGVTYTQYVRLLDLEELMRNGQGGRPVDIVREALKGDIQVHCTDPSWLYWGFKYIGTQDDYAVEPEKRYPKVRNPKLEGSVCKHLDNVLYILPFQANKIVRDMKRDERL